MGRRHRGHSVPRGLLAWLSALVGLPLVLVVGTGFLLDTPQPAPAPSDAIIVISGDEQLARFREGVRLFKDGMGQYLVFSGAARDNGTSNADVMRELAVEAGVDQSAILEDPLGEDTWGNAVYTRGLLEQRGARSAILVTSPYHARRAKMTFDAAYSGTRHQAGRPRRAGQRVAQALMVARSGDAPTHLLRAAEAGSTSPLPASTTSAACSRSAPRSPRRSRCRRR